MSVAVFENDQWQRAEIVSVQGSQVFLFFVDTGARKSVAASNLRYLEKMFASSPRKCYKGSLFGIKPKNGEAMWTPGAIMKFMFKTKEKKLFATIKGREDGFYQLSLVDDFLQKTRVEDYLVDMGFADKEEDVDYSKNGVLVSFRTKIRK